MSKSSKQKENHIVLAEQTLTGDLRDFLLDWSKHNHETLPWDLRPEKDQEAFVEAASKAASEYARKAVEIIDTRGQRAVPVVIESFAIKSDVKGQIKVIDNEDIHSMIHACGGKAYVVLSSFNNFEGARGDVKIRKDQGDIIGFIENKSSDDGETSP